MDSDFENIQAAVEAAKAQKKLGPIGEWVGFNEFEMEEKDAQFAVNAAWEVFNDILDIEYDQDISGHDELCAVLDSVATWAEDNDCETIDLKIKENFKATIEFVTTNEANYILFEFCGAIRKAKLLEQYKDALAILLEQAKTNWGYDDLGGVAVCGIEQLMDNADLTKEQADALMAIAEQHCSKSSLKSIKEYYEERADGDEGDYDSFHSSSDWSEFTRSF